MSATVKPLTDYVSGQQGRTGGGSESRTERRLDTGTVLQVLVVLAAVAAVVIAVFKG